MATAARASGLVECISVLIHNQCYYISNFSEISCPSEACTDQYYERTCRNQTLSDMLDALNHKDPTVIQQGNVELITQHMKEKEKLAAEIQRLKEVRVKT